MKIKKNKTKCRYFVYGPQYDIYAIYIVDETNHTIKKKYINKSNDDLNLIWTHNKSTGYCNLLKSIKDVCKEISEAEAFLKLL